LEEFLVMQGALAIGLSLFLMGAAQPQQQQQTPPPQQEQQSVPNAPVPDAPSPSGLSNLKGQVAPGVGSTADNKQGEDDTTAPQNKPATSPQLPAVQGGVPPTLEQPSSDVFRLVQSVTLIDVPITVRDKKNKLVPSLDWRLFRVYEDGDPKKISYFSVDPRPLQVAFVIDQTLPSDIMRKVNESLSALSGAFGPADTMAVFTYNTSPEMITDFTAIQGPRLEAALQVAKKPGRDVGIPTATGPMAAGIVLNGQIPDPNVAPQRGNSAGFLVVPKEGHPLNDAILYAAKALAKQPYGDHQQRILYVISDGKESRSKASLKEVVKYLLTNNITVYGTLVGDSATWGIGYLDKFHLPLLPTDNVLPKYTTLTGGSLEAQFSENGIQRSFSDIAATLRTQYSLWYYSNAPKYSEKHHSIDVRIEGITGLQITAKEGYYPSPSVQ
jgi:VWFA-related protein